METIVEVLDKAFGRWSFSQNLSKEFDGIYQKQNKYLLSFFMLVFWGITLMAVALVAVIYMNDEKMAEFTEAKKEYKLGV